MTQTYEFSLQDHYLLTDALETRLQRIDRLIHDWYTAEGSAPDPDSVASALVKEYRQERVDVEAMLKRINDGIRTVSNAALKKSAAL